MRVISSSDKISIGSMVRFVLQGLVFVRLDVLPLKIIEALICRLGDFSFASGRGLGRSIVFGIFAASTVALIPESSACLLTWALFPLAFLLPALSNVVVDGFAVTRV